MRILSSDKAMAAGLLSSLLSVALQTFQTYHHSACLDVLQSAIEIFANSAERAGLIQDAVRQACASALPFIQV